MKLFLQKYLNILFKNKISEPETSLKFILFKSLNFGLVHYNLFFKHLIKTKYIEKVIYHNFFKNKFLFLLKKRLNHYPIQYILGEWYFKDFIVKCKPPVLIPRIETEKIIDILTQHFSIPKSIDYNDNNLKFLEIGVGTGVIFISILKKYNHIKCIGLDIDSKCIDLSLINAKSNLINENRYFLIKENFVEFAEKFNEEKFSFIISNPPYIADGDERVMKDVVQYESHQALFSGSTGTYLIEEIIAKSRKLVKRKGFVLLEIGEDQEESVTNLLIKYKFSIFLFEKDIFNKIRFVLFYIN